MKVWASSRAAAPVSRSPSVSARGRFTRTSRLRSDPTGSRVGGRIEPKEDPDGSRKNNIAHDRGLEGNDDWPLGAVRKRVDRFGDANRCGDSQQNPDGAANRGKRHRLDKELPEDVPPAAPTAMRSPISRVRSVTETSMMFMSRCRPRAARRMRWRRGAWSAPGRPLPAIAGPPRGCGARSHRPEMAAGDGAG